MNRKILYFLLFIILIFFIIAGFLDSVKEDYIKLENRSKIKLIDVSLISPNFKSSPNIYIDPIEVGQTKEIPIILKDKKDSFSLMVSYLEGGTNKVETLIDGLYIKDKVQKRFTFLDGSKGHIEIIENKFGLVLGR